jgi:gliding motility-associated-like protein
MNKKVFLIALIGLCLLGCNQSKRVSPVTHFWCPSSFTPNGDGLNDAFNPVPHAELLFTHYHMIIFDDHLRVVFESNDKTEYWNPAQLNQDLPSGFYEFQIEYTCSEDSVNYNDYITSSTVNLIR